MDVRSDEGLYNTESRHVPGIFIGPGRYLAEGRLGRLPGMGLLELGAFLSTVGLNYLRIAATTSYGGRTWTLGLRKVEGGASWDAIVVLAALHMTEPGPHQVAPDVEVIACATLILSLGRAEVVR